MPHYLSQKTIEHKLIELNTTEDDLEKPTLDQNHNIFILGIWLRLDWLYTESSTAQRGG